MPCRGDGARSRTLVPEPCPRGRPDARGERGPVAEGYAMLCTPAPGARGELLADMVARGPYTMRPVRGSRHRAALEVDMQAGVSGTCRAGEDHATRLSVHTLWYGLAG